MSVFHWWFNNTRRRGMVLDPTDPVQPPPPDPDPPMEPDPMQFTPNDDWATNNDWDLTGTHYSSDGS